MNCSANTTSPATTPIVIGSALKALKATSPTSARPSIFKLADALDSYIPMPERAIDKPFLMPVEDVFSISGRGTVVTGRVERHHQGRVRKSRSSVSAPPRRPPAPAWKCSASCWTRARLATTSAPPAARHQA